MQAKAKLVEISPYRSDSERAFATFGKELIEDFVGQKVFAMDYEPESFNIPGAHYTPDFRCIMSSGYVVFVEVKGSKKQRNYRDARSKLRATSELNPYYTFLEVRLSLSRGVIKHFEIEVIK